MCLANQCSFKKEKEKNELVAIPGVVLGLLENEGRHGQGRLRAVGRAKGDHRVLPDARGQVEDLPGAEVETDQ